MGFLAGHGGRFMNRSNAAAQRSPATLFLALAATILFAGLPRPAFAVTYTWNGVSGGIWDLSSTNWANATGDPWDGTNGPTNAATFNLTGSNSATVSGLVTTNNLTFAPTTTGTFGITGGTIALGGGTSARIMNLLSGGTVGTTTASTLTIASTITSSTNFFIGGYGTTILSGSNSLSGTVTIGSGTSSVVNPEVRITNSSALDGATAVFLIGSGSNTDQGQRLTLGNGVTIAGITLSGSVGNSRAALLVAAGSSGTWAGDITGNVSLYANGTLTIGTGTSTTVSNTLRGSGTGVVNSRVLGINKTDPGTWIINSPANTFTTNPSVSSGVIQIASIADRGVASPIGSGTTISVGNASGSGLSSFGQFGLLRIVSATGGASNRPFTVTGGTWAGGGSGGGIESGTAGQTLTMSGSVTATGSAATFVLAGAGDGVYSGNILATGTTTLGLFKANAGTWTLSGSNSFAGPVYLNGGVLALGSSNALGTSGTIRFGGGAAANATLRFGPNFTSDLSTKILSSTSAIGIDTNGQNVTFGSSLAVSNTAGLMKTGLGTLTLSASNAYLGTTTVNGGTLAIGNLYALTTTTPTVVVNAGALDLAGNALTLTSLSGTSEAGAITSSVAGALVVTATSAGNTTYAGGINDGAATIALTKIGSGTLTLSGSSNYTGGTTISGGALALSGAGALLSSGSVSLTAAGATLDISGVSASGLTLGAVSSVASSTVALGGKTLTVGDTTSGTFAGVFSGVGGGLSKSGAGTLTLTGASSYTGPTTIAGGTLALSGGANRLSTTSALAFTGGTVALNAVSQTVAGLTVADSTSAAVVGIGASTIGVTNAIALGGGVGPSTLLFQPLLSGSTASNLTVTATSGITVAAGGDLQLGAFGYTTGTFTNPDVFRTASGTTTPVTINGGSLTLTPMVTSGGQTTIGSAGAVSNQVGALTMTSGTISISVAVNTDRRLGAYGDVNITGGAIVNPTGNGGLIELFRYTNVLSPASPLPTGMAVSQYMPTTGTTATLAAGVGLRGGLFVRNGVGTLVLTSSATGANIGALQLGDNSATPGAGTTLKMGSDLTLVAGAALPTLHFTNTAEAGGRIDVGIDTDGYAFNLTGNTGVWQPSTSGTFQSYWQLSSSSGTGRFVANGYDFVTSNAFTSVGPNVVLESRSGNGVANNLGSSGTSGLATIDPTSTFVYSGTAALATPSTLTAARSIGNLEVAGSGALRLLAISGSVGNVGVSNGRLILGGTSIPVLPSVAVTGGTFDLNGYGATITDLTGSAGGTITSSSNTTTTLTVGGDNSTRYDGVLANSAGTLNFVKQGAGTLTLGGASTFTGTTTISAGSLTLDNSLALENSTFDTAGSASLSFGTLTAASFGGLTGSGNIDLTALAGGLTIGGGNRSSTYEGVLSGAGGLTKTGTGTFILTGSQAYGGVTTISQGTLQLGNGGSTGWLPAAAVTNNATLAFSRSDNVTFSSGINGSGSVTQSGGGVLTLSGSNGYTGGTLIGGTGSLSVASAAALGTGTITLQTTQISSPNAILSLTSGMILANPIVMSQSASNRNNIWTTGSTTLSGPITITGIGAGANVFQNNGSRLTITGNITGTAFAGSVSFRGSTTEITGTVNMPSAVFDLNAGGTTIISSTGNVWSYTQFQGSNNVLRLGATDAMPTSNRVQFSGDSTGGGLDLNGFSQTIAGLTSVSGSIAAPRAQIYNSAATASTLTLAGLTADRSSNVALTNGTGGGTLALVMNSAGRTQTLASATSSYSGGTTIVAGTLALGAANALGATSGALAVNGGALDLRGFGLSVGLLSGSSGGVITSGTAGAVTFTASSAADSTFAGLIQNGLGTVGLTKAGSGALTLTAAHTYTGPTDVNGGVLAVNGSLTSAVTVGTSGEIGGAGSVGVIGGAGLVGPGNSPGILTAPSVDPSGGLDFAFEFTQAAPNYASASSSDNDVLWLTDSTPFTSSLTGANTVSIYLTQSAAALSELTGGFFTATSGDFFASISGASFQYFVQDAAGTFSYNGQAYKTLAQYDPSKSISVATVGANGGQVMQLVVVPEPGAIVLAGVGIAAAAWATRRRRNS
jgi:fibronectin-binding autotransporter adhesin